MDWRFGSDGRVPAVQVESLVPHTHTHTHTHTQREYFHVPKLSLILSHVLALLFKNDNILGFYYNSLFFILSVFEIHVSGKEHMFFALSLNIFMIHPCCFLYW
jgi:hypothetical protein